MLTEGLKYERLEIAELEFHLTDPSRNKGVRIVDFIQRLPTWIPAAVFLIGTLALTSCWNRGPSQSGKLELGGAGIALQASNALLAVTLQNTGNVDASGVEVDAIDADGATLTPSAPIAVGTIRAGAGVPVNATLTKAGLQPGGTYKLSVRGKLQFGSGASERFTLGGFVRVPVASPGSRAANSATAPAHKTGTEVVYPIQTPSVGGEENGSRWSVPVVPNATYLPPSKPASKPQPAPTGDPKGISFNVNQSNGFSGGSPDEPSGATGGGVTFMTANTYGSYSTGGSFTRLNPSSIFQGSKLGTCCDQVVQYIPSIDRFVWLLQGNNTDGMRLATASPAQMKSSNGLSWTYWDLPPTLFSEPSGTGYDYPDLAVGTNYLYIDWDACWKGKPPGCNSGREIVRIPLSQIQSGASLSFNYTTPSDSADAWSAHLSQDTGSEIFWAGHDRNNQIRVFSWPESSGSYSWHEVTINAWPTASLSSTTPDGNDWMSFLSGFPGNGVIGATVASGQVWFAWSAGTNSNFPQPHVEMVEINPSSFSLTQQVQIWNPSYAYGYPSLATNACTQEVGLSLEYGGGGNYENHVVGFWGDFVVYITTNSNVGTTRFGDYVTIRQDPTSSLGGRFFDAFGYGLDQPGATADAHYVVFGRPQCQGR